MIITSGFIYLFGAYVVTESFRSEDRQSLFRDTVLSVFTAVLALLAASQISLWLAVVLFGLLQFVTARVLTRQDGSARRWLIRQFIMLAGAMVIAQTTGLLARTQLHTFVEWIDELVIMSTAILLIVPFGVQFMKRSIRPFALVQTDAAGGGFPNGGKVIGQYERLLILIFVLLDAPTAIGFLVAGKSIFRFGDLTDTSSRRAAEYILIGTLMSFTYALVVAYGARFLLTAIP